MSRMINMTGVLVLVGCLLGPLLSMAQQQRGVTVERRAQQRIALVIGNSNYEQGALRNPANDARSVAAALKDLGFDVTLSSDLNLRQMDDAVRDFGLKIKKGGIGLFYFAGHGVQVDGVNYLAPVGVRVEKEQDIKFEMLDIGKVTAEMEVAKNGLNILIVDACRNNPFVRSFRSPISGLAPINAPSGTYIAFATAPGTTASDGDGENGLYTQELLANLKQPGLRLEDIFIRTRVAVKKKTNDLQVPWENGALEGVVVLNENGGAAATPSGASGASGASVASTASTASAGAPLPHVPVISYSGIPLSTLRSEKFMTASLDEKGSVSKRESGPASFYTEDLGNGVKLEMVYIRGGSFQMGSPRTEAERDEEEIQHQVRVSGFWMGRYEVTQAQWLAVMGRLPNQLSINDQMPKGDDLPITCASWVEVQKFIANLNELLKLKKGRGYKLPREAEWEYAARGGTTTPFPYGATITPELANYDWSTSYGDSPTRPRASTWMNIMKVGSFPANPYGLYDMFGNVYEYCEDWLGEYPPPGKDEQIDPTGPAEGERRVVRGGDYETYAKSARAARRVGYLPDTDRYASTVGFRLVRR